MPTDWTPEQLIGITTVGQSLLVSAAAGSGKTAMLAERCAHLVCDADDPCDADELLVVTFTEAAAAEMKSRIAQALRSRTANEDPGGRAARNLKLIDAAHVSTLHSFCARVLRQHFHLVGLDPAFTVLDGEEAHLMRTEVARKLFEDRYELDDAGNFERFVDAYGDGDDQRLLRLVIRAHEMLTSLVEPGEWLAHAYARLDEAARVPLGESELGRELHEKIARELDSLAERCERSIDQVQSLGGFDKYVAVLRDARQIIKHWAKVFRQYGLSALREESQVEFDRLPSVPNTVPNKAVAKAAVDSLREAMKGGTWRDLLRFSPDEWTQGVRATLPHARVFLQLIEQFARRYRAEKDLSRALDFADLERFTLRVLREKRKGATLVPSPAALSFHRRFKHVLVDEYQDINEVQDAILTLVSSECVCDERGVQRANLFTVGDVKQSIYRFRLAEAGRFLERERQFRDDGGKRMGGVVDLQKNFRSRSTLLDAINGVFARLMTAGAVDIHYDETHRLHPGAAYPPGDDACTFAGAPIEMHLLPTKLDVPSADEECEDEASDLDRAEREAVVVARRIREMLGLDGTGKPPICVTEKENGYATRPMRFGDVVILLRSMKFKADQYAEVLRQHGIPVHSESGTGFFESTEVNDLLSLLSLLNNARQDIPLAAVLRSPLANLPQPEESLARIRLAHPPGSGLAFHEAVSAYARDKEDDIAANLRTFFAALTRWRELAQRRPLADLIIDVFERTGYLAYCAGLSGGEQRVANLEYLLERARQFGTFHRQGLSRFMQFMESLREESDLGQPSVAGEDDDVVRIMSVHRSKGLEFPVVFLPDLGKAINFDDCHGSILLDRRAGLGMSVVDDVKKVRYPSLALAIVRGRLRQQTLAEEMRVLYVALTRAKEHVVLVGTCGADAEEQWRSRWAGHDGPLPTDLVLGATKMLDWLGPVAAASGLTDEIIRIRTHTVEEVTAWRGQAKRREVLTPQQLKLVGLDPLAPPPPANVDAQELIARLTSSYPHERFATLAAAEPMSAHESRGVVRLQKPRFMLEAGSLSAVDVGAATHLVLQHLDFRRACDRADLQAQIADLVERKLIADAQAQAVDVDSLVWLAESAAGQFLKRHATKLLREVPIYLARHADTKSSDDQDQVMLRGRLDVLIPEPDGCVLIDYKTDKTPAGPSHVDQLQTYRTAVEAMTNKPVKQVLLVYLVAREIRSAT
jgi:ATP-dependent helicase/nuclease subunit A